MQPTVHPISPIIFPSWGGGASSSRYAQQNDDEDDASCHSGHFHFGTASFNETAARVGERLWKTLLSLEGPEENPCIVYLIFLQVFFRPPSPSTESRTDRAEVQYVVRRFVHVQQNFTL
jgi:hypothetical protein